MSRKASGRPIELFPFLAVLICAMGALILLLLVTTRRLRQQAVERARIEQAQAAEIMAFRTEYPVPEPVAATAPTVSEPLPTAPRPPAEAVAPQPDLEAERLAAEAALAAQWQATVDELERKQAAAQRELRAGRSAIAAQQELLQDSSRRRSALDQSLAAVTSRRSAVDEQRSRISGAQQALQREIDDIEARREQVQRINAVAEGKFSLLPYDGGSGTTRRPIVIECRGSSLTFASEGVELSAAQVTGFPPTRNPLLAGTQALVDYWTGREKTSPEETPGDGPPYVLLVVRPGGTIAYYVARQLLEDLNDPFGYELVTHQQEFDWPETTPEARAACQRAIEDLLRNRERIVRTTRDARMPIGGALNFAGPNGEFQLSEVEKLKNPTSRPVYFGGQRWDRAAQMRATESAARSGDQPSPRGGSTPPSEPAGARAGEFPGARPTTANGPTPDSTPAPEGGAGTPSADRPLQPRAAWTPRPPSPHSGSAPSNLPPGLRNVQNEEGTPGTNLADLANPFRPGDPEELDPRKPEFGIRLPGSIIGFDRHVDIRVDARQVILSDENGEGPTIDIHAAIARDELQQQLAIALDKHVRSWGPPPRSFYWKPSIRFVIRPGGNQYQARLASAVEEWGVRSTVTYELP